MTTTLTRARLSMIVTAIVASALVAVTVATPAHAARVESGNTTNISNLGELLVLDSLFDGGTGAAQGENGSGTRLGTSRLGELIVLTEIFEGDGSSLGSSNGTSNLGELLVLDNLFGGDGAGQGDGLASSRLGELIVLTGIFDDGVSGGGTVTVVVEPGDTLSEIAAEFDTTVSAIVRMNNIADPNLIFVGERLRVPVGEDATGRASVSSDTNLGELLVLDGLFSGDGTATGGGVSRLGELIVLTEIFGSGGLNLNL